MSPRTGRPKSEKPKDVRFSIRLDDETYSRIHEYSEKTGKTVAETIRLAISEFLDTVK